MQKEARIVGKAGGYVKNSRRPLTGIWRVRDFPLPDLEESSGAFSQ
jgi:hypothetical protein